jgi:acyl carrier protein
MINKIKLCAEKIFKKKIKNFEKLKIGDLKEWDSLGHINLLLEIEKKFKIKFSMKEISELNSIKKITERLKKIK